MIVLPNNIPKNLRDTFSEALGHLTLKETLHQVNQGTAKLFRASSALLFFERLSANAESVVDKHFTTAGEMFENNVLAEEWMRSGIHTAAKQDLEQRLAAISHSSYSWPYPSISNEYAERILFPAGYTVLIPFSSSLIVKRSGDASFFGYVALFFEGFPELDEEIIGLIISLPGFLSEFISALLRHYEASTVQGNALAHDFKQYVLLNRQLVYRAQESIKKGGDDLPAILRRIDAAASRMLTLTSQVMLADRDYAGTLAVRPLSLDLNGLIQDVLKEAEPRFELGRVELNATLDEAVPEIKLDPAIFPSVLNNLLDNALKYSQKEDARAEVQTKRINDDFVSIRVSDNGIGIPEQDRPKIFEKHFRAGNTKQKGGNGIGLYLVRKIVEAHKGTISLIDSPENMTVFEILLPIKGPVPEVVETKEES